MEISRGNQPLAGLAKLRPAPAVVAHALMDGTEKGLETFVCSDLDRLRSWQAKNPGEVVSAQLSRYGGILSSAKSISIGMMRGLFSAATVLGPLAGAALGFFNPESMAVGLTAGARLAASGAVSTTLMGNGLAQVRQGLAALPAWAGVRHYQLGAEAGETKLAEGRGKDLDLARDVDRAHRQVTSRGVVGQRPDGHLLHPFSASVESQAREGAPSSSLIGSSKHLPEGWRNFIKAVSKEVLV